MKSSIDRCRVCNTTIRSKSVTPILDFGRLPLANRLSKDPQSLSAEERFRLNTIFCGNCHLFQITESPKPEVLFKEYAYLSSCSEQMMKHWRLMAERLMLQQNIDRESFVVEAASNDGYLMQHFVKRGIPVLGIDPAENVAPIARSRGVKTICDFFGDDLAQTIVRKDGQADIFVANNVLAHVPNLMDFIQGAKTVLGGDGLAVFEVPYVKSLVDNNEFDTIYHEHIYYFSLTSLQYLLAQRGLEIIDVERHEVHGGSLRVFAKHAAENADSAKMDSGRARVAELLSQEKAWGLDDVRFFESFASNVRSLKMQLQRLISTLKSQGKRIAAYGASAKGSTLLNYCGIGGEAIDFIVDRNPMKQGLFTPGNQISIFNPNKLVEQMPDFVLLLTWNLREEIMQQQTEYRRKGGKFIIPIPEPVIA